MSARAPRVAIGGGSIERAAANARSSTLFASRFAAFKEANAKFIASCADPAVSDEETDVLCDRASDACLAFTATPAPDHAGISLKISTLNEWHDGTLAPLDVVNSIADDARALLNGEG